MSAPLKFPGGVVDVSGWQTEDPKRTTIGGWDPEDEGYDSEHDVCVSCGLVVPVSGAVPEDGTACSSCRGETEIRGELACLHGSVRGENCEKCRTR